MSVVKNTQNMKSAKLFSEHKTIAYESLPDLQWLGPNLSSSSYVSLFSFLFSLSFFSFLFSLLFCLPSSPLLPRTYALPVSSQWCPQSPLVCCQHPCAGATAIFVRRLYAASDYSSHGQDLCIRRALSCTAGRDNYRSFVLL